MNVHFIENVGQIAHGKIVVMGNPTRLTSLQQAESLLAAGKVDIVGAVRAFLAEPELIKKRARGWGVSEPHLHRFQLLPQRWSPETGA